MHAVERHNSWWIQRHMAEQPLSTDLGANPVAILCAMACKRMLLMQNENMLPLDKDDGHEPA